MNLHRTIRAGMGAAVAVSSLAVVSLFAPLSGSAASAATNCSPSAITGKVNLTFWEGILGTNEKLIQALVTQFNKTHSNIHVTDVNQSGGYISTWNDYLAALKTHSTPNVALMDQYITQGAVDSKSFTPVATCIAGTGYSTATFSKKALAQETVGGKLFAMPYSEDAPILIYNKNAFTKAGITTPPTTVAQMATDAAKLKAHGFKDGMTIKLDPWWLQTWLGTGHDYFVNNQNGRTSYATAAAFNDTVGKSVFTQLQGIVKAHDAVTNPATGSITTAYQNLYQIGFGYSGMTIDASATLGNVLALLPSFPKVKLGVAALPNIASAAGGGVQPGGNALFLPTPSNSSPAKMAASWEFIQYLVSAGAMATWDAGTGYVPGRSDATTNSAMVKFWTKYPQLKAAYTELSAGPVDNSTTGPLLGNYYTVSNDIALAENQLMSPPYPSPSTVLANAASKVTADIVKYNHSLGR